MIDAVTYQTRRNGLRALAKGGVVLILGHRLLPRNYKANTYPFRQNSNLLYCAGVAHPGHALVIGETPDEDVLYGPPTEVEDVVWHGPHETLEDFARAAGVRRSADVASLAAAVRAVTRRGGDVRYLPPYQADSVDWLAELLGQDDAVVRRGACRDLMRAVAALRSKKEKDEIAEIEDALGVSAAMHIAAMRATRAGRRESDVRAAIERTAIAADRGQSYNPIVTVRGEVLHNNTYANVLEDGQLLLNDSGAESPRYYASDITRTFPVSGRFDARQKDVYETVLRAQTAAIAAVKPGVPYRDVHLLAARLMTDGLKAIGLMKGSTDAAVEAGAHALFFCHGLGHMLGLDVHDMEDLGEDIVGYGENRQRSTQFGLAYLRLARPLEEGFVFTVEPGLYFIPALIDRWQAAGLHRDFIVYEKLSGWRTFGGIRIEDNVLCTAAGPEVLGPGIPKTVAAVEALVGRDA